MTTITIYKVMDNECERSDGEFSISEDAAVQLAKWWMEYENNRKRRSSSVKTTVLKITIPFTAEALILLAEQGRAEDTTVIRRWTREAGQPYDLESDGMIEGNAGTGK